MKKLILSFALLAVVILPSLAHTSEKGPRVGLCGELTTVDSAYILRTPNLPPIQLLDLQIEGLEGPLGACVVGADLPEQDTQGSLTFSVDDIDFDEHVLDYLGKWVAPVKVCGTVRKSSDTISIQFGSDEEQMVYLEENGKNFNHSGKAPKGNPCAFGKALPKKAADGKLKFDAYDLNSDWDKSGVSIGNL